MMSPWRRGGCGDASGRAAGAQAAAGAAALFFLAACSPPAADAPGSTAVLSQGGSLYEQLCARCHADGRGSLTAPALTGSAIVKNSPGKMIGQILRGSQGRFTNVEGREVPGVMPPQDSLSDEDVAAVVTYVRHEFGRVDQLTTPAEVAALR